MKSPLIKSFALFAVVSAAACSPAVPGNDVPSGDATADTFVPTDNPIPTDNPTPTDAPNPTDGGANTCGPLPTDYQPRMAMRNTMVWPACRSDMNAFVPYGMGTVPSTERVGNFDRMNINPMPVTNAMGMTVGIARPMAFFDANRDPSRDEFTSVAAYYATAGAMSGLVDRFARRPDEHYPQPAAAVMNPMTGEYDDHWCNADANWMAQRDYCVGPASLRPPLQESMMAGSMGMLGMHSARWHAARIEASLFWIMQASVYKESLSCLQDVEDCDSAWGYYTGGVERNGAMQAGIARYIKAVDAETHNRIWDGLLALRCWRDADGGLMAPPPVAMNRALRERARDQLERALTRGVMQVVATRLTALAATDGMPAAEAHRGFISVVGPLIARGLETWIPMKYATTSASVGAAAITATAAALRSPTISGAQATAAADLLLRIFPCN